MVKHQAAVVVACLVLLIGAAPGMVRADDPTPTVTPYPMPTRQFSDLRPTPSPWAITPSGNGFNIDGGTKAGELADTIINGYRFINFGATETTGGVIDFVIFVAMGLLVVRALYALATGAGDDDE